MLISGLYTHSFSYTRRAGSGWRIKVITEVTQTLMCSLPMTVKTGHKAAHPRLLCLNTMITLCQVDNRTQTHSDLRTKMSVDIQVMKTPNQEPHAQLQATIIHAHARATTCAPNRKANSLRK